MAEWEHFYNDDRPHGSLGGRATSERFTKETTNEFTDVVSCIMVEVVEV